MVTTGPWLLAQTKHTVDILVSLGWLIAGAAVLILLGYLFYRWVVGPIADSGDDDGFGLSDLRRLHREGHLTDEEYDRAKSRLLAGFAHEHADEEDEEMAGPVDENEEGETADGDERK